jgi:hypothetical protein
MVSFARQALVCLIAVGLVCSVACDAGSSGNTVVPSGQGGDSELEPEGEFEGESIDELLLRLNKLSGQREQLVTSSSQDPQQCEELCELSRAICEVKDKMCEIADERVADDEYQNLCRVAKQRCEQASNSCVRCVQDGVNRQK